MPADLDLLNAFTAAISGEHVSLPGPRGTITVPKSDFELAFRELAMLRADVGGQDAAGEQAQQVLEGLVDLLNMAEEQQAAAIPVEMLTALFGQDEEPEPADPAVSLVRDLLRSLGVEASDETGAAFLAALAQHNGAVPAAAGRHRAPEPEEYDDYPDEDAPQQLFQAVSRPAPRAAVLRPPARNGARPPMLRPVAKTAPMLPPNGVPIPSTPTVDPNKYPITAEALFGLKRSASGRFDAGALES